MTNLDAVLFDLVQEVFILNSNNGWFEDKRSVGDEIALLHSEVSEMLEAFREFGLARHNEPIKHQKHCTFDPENKSDVSEWPYEICPTCGAVAKPSDFNSEVADVFIRVLDVCKRHGINLAEEYRRKMAYNRTRGYKHGGKLL